MELLLIIAALVGVVVFFSAKEAKKTEQLKQREELLDAIEKAQVARAAVSDPDHRRMLIEELREGGQSDSLLRGGDSSDQK